VTVIYIHKAFITHTDVALLVFITMFINTMFRITSQITWFEF